MFYENVRNMPRFTMRKETYHLVVKTLVTMINFSCPVNADCVSYELSESVGHYCSQPGTILHSMTVSECQLKCLNSVYCEAFNHNTTDNTCTLLTIFCPVIISNPAIKYAVFGPNNPCYEWVPYVPADPLVERMVTVDGGVPLSYLSRIHADGIRGAWPWTLLQLCGFGTVWQPWHS